jgi:sulfite exporter TauE/SafE
MYLTAFILGISGSLHCAGMCSPLVMAVTSQKSFWIKVIYNSGRVLSYGAMGAVAAQLGQFAFLHSYQAVLSVVLGLSLLLLGLGIIPGVTIPFLTKAISSFSLFLKGLLGKFLQRKSAGSTFMLGVLNGFIPCGISSMALAYCLILPDAFSGFSSMIIFGLGTWPVMVFLPWLAGWSGSVFKFNYRKATVLAMVLSGLLLIVHGVMDVSTHSVISSGVMSSIDINLCQ